jgi:IS605 OrfB family transposase
VVAARTVRDRRGRCTSWHDPARVAAVKRLARAKEREGDARRDALHKLSRRIVNDYDGIAVEALAIRNMLRSAKGTVEDPGRNVAAKSGLNRSIADAGWGTLVTLLREKAESAGRVVVSVDPKNTSRCCAQCGHIAAASRDGTRFACVKCGHRDHADVNAARVALGLGSTMLAKDAPNETGRCSLRVFATSPKSADQPTRTTTTGNPLLRNVPRSRMTLPVTVCAG